MSILNDLDHFNTITRLEDEVANLREQIEHREQQIRELTAENAELKRKTDNRPKLSKRDVALIRRFKTTTGMSNRELAESFDVNTRTIDRIVNGEYHRED